MLEEARGAQGVLNLMKESSALLSGHFVLSSGLHSEKYIQCALLLEAPHRAEAVGRNLGRLVEESIGSGIVEVVVSPALGGIIIGHEAARALGARSIFVERAAGTMTLRRGFGIQTRERVLIVEDVVTTGRSTNEVIRVVASQGGNIVGIGAIVNRGAGVKFGVPFAYLVRAEIENYDPKACPLCAAGVPLTKPGSRDIESKVM